MRTETTGARTSTPRRMTDTPPRMIGTPRRVMGTARRVWTGARAWGAVGTLVVGLTACRPAGELETRTFQLRYIEPDEAVGLLNPYVYGSREGAPGMMSPSPEAVTVRELPENLERIEAVLAEFDRPPATVSLHFMLIEADGFTASDPAIADVEEELRKLFNFQGYRLAARSTLQALEGGFVEQVVGDVGYRITGQVNDVDTEGGELSMDIELRGLFTTRVRIPLGETVVLGSGQVPGSWGGPEARAAILVVTPELVEERQQ